MLLQRFLRAFPQPWKSAIPGCTQPIKCFSSSYTQSHTIQDVKIPIPFIKQSITELMHLAMSGEPHAGNLGRPAFTVGISSAHGANITVQFATFTEFWDSVYDFSNAAAAFQFTKLATCVKFGKTIRNLDSEFIPIRQAKLWKSNTESQKHAPIICIHGWGDSVTAFEPLVPLLLAQRPDQTVLAFDLAGHGLSYHTPGTYSDLHLESLLAILRIIKHFNWEKVTMLGHSFGGLVGLSFTSTFPELVQSLIGIDIFHPIFVNIDGQNDLAMRRTSLEGILDMESKIVNIAKRPPPSYGKEEMVERMVKGRAPQGGLSKEGCEMFIERGAIQLPNGKFQFSHDPRNSSFFWLGRLSLWNVTTMAEAITCPTCLITCKSSTSHNWDWEDLPAAKLIVKKLQENAKSFNLTKVKGSHHVHMLEPQVVAPILNEFLS